MLNVNVRCNAGAFEEKVDPGMVEKPYSAVAELSRDLMLMVSESGETSLFVAW